MVTISHMSAIRVLLDMNLNRPDLAGYLLGIQNAHEGQPSVELILPGLGYRSTVEWIDEGIDGYIGPADRDVSWRLRERKVPTVSLYTLGDVPENQKVFIDMDDWSQQVLKHFDRSGTRRLAIYVTKSPNFRGAHLRHLAFVNAAEKQGRQVITIGSHRLRPWNEPSTPKQLAEHFHRLELALRVLPTPAAIACASDLHAWRIIETCRQIGMRVPQDVAVIGSNRNPAIAEVCRPRLTSVVYNHERLGYEAARLLDRLIKGRPAPKVPIRIPSIGIIPGESTVLQQVGDPLVDQAILHIHEQLASGINVNKLIEGLPASRRALERRFIKTLGRTPAEEVRRIRIERAKSLIATTSRPLSEVAAECGYSALSHLSRDFRNETGKAPSTYRREIRT